MNTYTAKTLEEALKLASEKEGCTVEELNYQVVEEKKGLFSKKVVIETYGIIDVITFSKEYLLNIISNYDLEGTVVEKFENGIIHLTIDTNHNSILIGKNGKTLQALNDVCRYAVAAKFKKHYRILLDINSYKNEYIAKSLFHRNYIIKEIAPLLEGAGFKQVYDFLIDSTEIDDDDYDGKRDISLGYVYHKSRHTINLYTDFITQKLMVVSNDFVYKGDVVDNICKIEESVEFDKLKNK